jgi:molybdenum transport protein
MHRLGLSETLLVFPEHRAFIAEAVFPLRMAQLKQNCPEKNWSSR